MSELIAINSSAQFSYGTFENTMAIGESVSLCQTAGRYIQAGCYTSQAVNCAPFTQLVAGACCDTPCKTVFELFVRVLVNGSWSKWLSYGKFSTLIKRRSAKEKCEEAVLENGILTLSGKNISDAFQLKVYLYSDTPASSPQLNMLFASVKPVYPQKQTSELTVRELPVPAYSQRVRNPVLKDKIAMPTAVSMLLNRHGEDILPEQAAHAMFDYELGTYGNISFAAALCGAFGYDSAAVFCDISFLKKEIRLGYPSAAVLKSGDAVVVRGFDTDENGSESIIINNPNSEGNDESVQKLPLESFTEMFSGLCLLLHDKRKNASTCAPVCRPACIKKEAEEEYRFYVSGIPLELSQSFLQDGDICEGTVCACAKNTTAFASAAQKSFEYLDISDKGNIVIEKNIFGKGTRVTVYALDSTGSAFAAEIII